MQDRPRPTRGGDARGGVLDSYLVDLAGRCGPAAFAAVVGAARDTCGMLAQADPLNCPAPTVRHSAPPWLDRTATLAALFQGSDVALHLREACKTGRIREARP
ncbi:hypothetical protein [Streptomyces sp. NPDC127112]|uniref:hypothetical protein n=1 Tax=Streptomyces sp. NPDC127112 TaxID=3345364 RepID=UPI003639A59F